MNQRITPEPHPDPWVNLLHGYVTQAVKALQNRSVHVQRSWLDPCDPRDATILYSSPDTAATGMLALVWDEERGWRSGRFNYGRPGTRTELADAAHIGGGLLPDPNEIAQRIAVGRTESPRQYRSYADWRDGLDDVLRSRQPIVR